MKDNKLLLTKIEKEAVLYCADKYVKFKALNKAEFADSTLAELWKISYPQALACVAKKYGEKVASKVDVAIQYMRNN